MKKTLLLAIAAAGVFTFSANAQYRPTGDDGITASPKVRQMLDSRKPAMTAPSSTVSSVAYKPTGEDGITASPKLRQTLSQTKTVTTAPSVAVAKTGYEPTGADGITASPKLREQLNERSRQIMVAPLK